MLFRGFLVFLLIKYEIKFGSGEKLKSIIFLWKKAAKSKNLPGVRPG